MGAAIRQPFILMLGGTSLTSGRLCNPPIPWTSFLLADMKGSPQCKGPVRIINTAQGGQTSNFGASQAALMAPLRPTHVLMEDFAINDCAIGPVSIPQATANFNSMVASYRAANPNVIIVHQTMSPASAADVNRTNLATYYTNGLTNAAANGLLSLDNYNGTVLVPGGWPKPLNPDITVGSFPPYLTWGGTWNPADKNAHVVLDGTNLIATISGVDNMARGTVSYSSGLHIFQTTFTTVVGAYNIVGIATAAASIADAQYVGSNIYSYGMSCNGNVYYNSAVIASPFSAFASGDVVTIAVNQTLNKIWFAKNGLWSGDPQAGTGGISITPGTYFPATSGGGGSVSTAYFASLGDGLHPLWSPTAFQQYSYPNIIAWARQAMAAYWP